MKETRKTVRDSETGVERVAMGHHINERAHIIERSRNSRTGESNENQELININEGECLCLFRLLFTSVWKFLSSSIVKWSYQTP